MGNSEHGQKRFAGQEQVGLIFQKMQGTRKDLLNRQAASYSWRRYTASVNNERTGEFDFYCLNRTSQMMRRTDFTSQANGQTLF